MELTPWEIKLAANGVDIASLDRVARRINSRLTEADTDSFYELINAFSRNEDLVEIPSSQLTALLKNPDQHILGPTLLSGKVRRVSKITIPEQQTSGPSKLSDYFQIDTLVSLNGGKVLIRGKKNDHTDRSKALEIENRYPVIVCAGSLPGPSPQELVGKTIRFEGIFFKLWNFESELTAESENKNQIAPLIIAHRPQILSFNSEDLEWQLNLTFGFIGIAVIGLVMGISIFVMRQDRRDEIDRRRADLETIETNFKD